MQGAQKNSFKKNRKAFKRKFIPAWSKKQGKTGRAFYNNEGEEYGSAGCPLNS